jgi:hypothetical protein
MSSLTSAEHEYVWEDHRTIYVSAQIDPDLPTIGDPDDVADLHLFNLLKDEGKIPVTYPLSHRAEYGSVGPTLMQIGPNHKRSLDVPKKHTPSILGDVSIKGARLEKLRAVVRTGGFSSLLYRDIWGGMIYRDAQSAHFGSELMHSRGVDFGERILAVAKLETIPTPEGILPTDQVRRGLRKNHKSLLKYPAKSEDFYPVVVIRSMPNSNRLSDIDLGLWVSRRLVARAIKITSQQAPTLAGDLNPESSNDRLRYLLERLPAIVGYTFGRLTHAGLRQIYPHSGNMSLSLGVPDTDGIVMSDVFTHGPGVSYHFRNALRDILGVKDEFEVKQLMDIYKDAYKSGKKGKHVNEL